MVVVDVDILRQLLVPPFGPTERVVVPFTDDKDADDEGREPEESQSHLPGEVENGF